MMEIAYGPVILGCLQKSILFAVLFSLLYPILETRMSAVAPDRDFTARMGLGLVAGGAFGLADLAIACASDGFPPRIIQSTAAGLVMIVASGLALMRWRRRLTTILPSNG